MAPLIAEPLSFEASCAVSMEHGVQFSVFREGNRRLVDRGRALRGSNFSQGSSSAPRILATTEAILNATCKVWPVKQFDSVDFLP